MVNRERLIQTFQKMVSIDSPSLEEREMADYLTAQLNGLGFTVTEDNAGETLEGNTGNLYARLEGDLDLPPLLFCAHMDTVEPSRGKVALVHGDGRITSAAGDTVLGADDCGGLAAILEAVRSIRENEVRHRPIEILFTVVEEKYCLGAFVFDFSKVQAKEAYVLDLTGPVGAAANQAPTILSFTVGIKGRAAHAGFAPQEGIHAVQAAARAIGTLELGAVDEETTCNIGVIEGGLAPNIVPENCRVRGEIRSYSHGKAIAQMEDVRRAFTKSAQAVGGEVDIQVECTCEAYQTDPGQPVVRRFQRICAALGLPFSLQPTFGGSDNNAMAKAGIAGIVIANAMNNCHSCDEYSSVEELERIAELTYRLMTFGAEGEES